MELNQQFIFLNKKFDNCEQCIRFIGQQMVKYGIATPQYTEAMLDVIHQFKGVIVLAEGFALAHARPEQGVLKTGLVFLQLAEPLDFYHQDFKQVNFIIGLASTGADEHIKLIQHIALLIENNIQKQHFKSKEDVISFIHYVLNLSSKRKE